MSYTTLSGSLELPKPRPNCNALWNQLLAEEHNGRPTCRALIEEAYFKRHGKYLAFEDAVKIAGQLIKKHGYTGPRAYPGRSDWPTNETQCAAHLLDLNNACMRAVNGLKPQPQRRSVDRTESIRSAAAGGRAMAQSYGAFMRRKQRLLKAGYTEQQITDGKLASSEAKTQAAIGRKSVARSVAAAAAGGRATGQSYGAFKQREKRLLDAGYTEQQITDGKLASSEAKTQAALKKRKQARSLIWIAGGVLVLGAVGAGVYYWGYSR